MRAVKNEPLSAFFSTLTRKKLAVETYILVIEKVRVTSDAVVSSDDVFSFVSGFSRGKEEGQVSEEFERAQRSFYSSGHGVTTDIIITGQAARTDSLR